VSPMEQAGQTYGAAGVDLEAASQVVRLIKQQARSTLRPEVLSGVGFFGGLFKLGAYKEPVLVSSADGVGTKLKIAAILGKYDTVGIDLVNHCVNDILTCGAEPLFFLDYIAMGRLIPQRVEEIIKGMAVACREVNCTLIGGETAEMPGIYVGEDYDLVGFIVGVVEKDKLIDGKSIRPGDLIIGLPSSGLHTNGYSLVRKIFGEEKSGLEAYYPELGHTLAEELLRPHHCYYTWLKPHLAKVKGLAHITGGGIPGNLPRVLPEGLCARVESGSWDVPPIFQLIQKEGQVSEGEMFRVFNMGLGMVLVCSPDKGSEIIEALPQAKIIGEVIKGEMKFILDRVG